MVIMRSQSVIYRAQIAHAITDGVGYKWRVAWPLFC